MIKQLYIMRHAETLFNAQHRTQGWSDSPLTAHGIEQTHETREFMAHFPVKFDGYYCSTQERASDSFELVFPGVPYQRLKGLKEQNFGAFEAHPQYLEVEEKSTFFAQFGGETREQVYERMIDCVKSLLAPENVQTIFCVSHGGAIFSLIRHAVDAETLDKIHADGQFKNLAMAHFSYDTDSQELSFIEIIKTLKEN